MMRSMCVTVAVVAAAIGTAGTASAASAPSALPQGTAMTNPARDNPAQYGNPAQEAAPDTGIDALPDQLTGGVGSGLMDGAVPSSVDLPA